MAYHSSVITRVGVYCPRCGYKGERSPNIRRCPECRGLLKREDKVAEEKQEKEQQAVTVAVLTATFEANLDVAARTLLEGITQLEGVTPLDLIGLPEDVSTALHRRQLYFSSVYVDLRGQLRALQALGGDSGAD